MAILLPYPNIFDSDGRPCRQQPALTLPPTTFNMHRCIRVPEPYDLTLRIWIALPSPLYTIRDPSLIVLEREQAEVAAAGVPTPLTSHLSPLTSSPPSKRWWPGNAGWSCMLRTGQSLLVTTLLHLHLGRGM